MVGNNMGGRFLATYSSMLTTNRKVGGLRVKQITSHDGISSANDIIRTYSYEDTNSFPPGQSSGELYNEPRYWVGLTFYPCPGSSCGSQCLNCPGFEGNSQSGGGNVYFFDNSIVPLGSFEGHHIGYLEVTEHFNGNGRKWYKFFGDEPGCLTYGSNNIYPAPPAAARIVAGNVSEVKTYNANGDEVAREVNTNYVDPYECSNGPIYKVQSISTGCGSTSPLTTPYEIRTRPYRLLKTESTLDSVTTVTEYTYDTNGNHLSPTSQKVTNSDGKEHLTEYSYIFSYPYSTAIRDSLKALNMIASPWRTDIMVDGTQVNGSETEYAFFNLSTGAKQVSGTGAVPRRHKFYNYEKTWDANGNLTGPGKTLDATIGSYDANGNPATFTRDGWETESYTWQNGLIKTRQFIGYNWQYDYYANTRLVSKKTGIDGLETKFEYDAMMRLKKAKDRYDGTTYNRWTDYAYNIGGSVDSNYVHVTENFTPVDSSALTQRSTWRYFDGLGRLDQSVEQQKSPTQKDMVSKVLYDNQGRVYKRFVPYQSPNSTEKRYDHPWSAGGFRHFLSGYEASPLNRDSSITPPNWYATTTAYGSNAANEVIKDHATNAYFAANELAKTTMTNPDGNRTITFTDKLGRLVLTRREDSGGSNSTETYHLYDDKNRPSKVLPPGANLSTPGLLFSYVYDERDNLVKKKAPDADTTSYWYNGRDLPIFMQDGNMLAGNLRICTHHDAYGRVAQTGFVPHDSAPSGNDPLPTDLLTETVYGITGISTGKAIHSRAKVLGTPNFLDSYNSYDSYGRLVQVNGNNHLNSDTLAERTDFTYDFAGNVLTQSRDHLADSVTHTIDEAFTYDHWGRTINHYHRLNNGTDSTDTHLSNNVYDGRSRLIDKNLHGVTGGGYLQKVDYTYNDQDWLLRINDPYNLNGDLFGLDIKYSNPGTGFSGAVQPKKDGNISRLTWRTASFTEEHTYGFGYDFLDRLTGAEFRTEGTVVVTTSSSGPQAPSKDYSCSYTYDERGNILHLNRRGLLPLGSYGTVDSLDLSYVSQTNQLNVVYDYVDIPCTPTYNLSGTQDADAEFRAAQSITSTQTITNGAVVSYHARDSITLDTSFQVDSSSTFSAVTEQCRHPLAGFVDGAGNYAYDANGNMAYDPDKGITIYYNHLNLPDSVMFGGGQWIKFQYDANGNKLKKSTSVAGTKHYINGVEYQGGQMEAIYHAEGRAVPDTVGGFRYEYTLRDHLGNSRVMFSDLNGDGAVDSTEIIQENHYYPFGMNMQGGWSSGTNRYQYNGKELDNDFGVNWYHYGARMYDPALGRFTGVDPISDQFPWVSTYNYAENRPIVAVDLHGLQAFLVHGVMSNPSGFKVGKMPDFIEHVRSNVTNSKSVNASFSWDNRRTRKNGKKGIGRRNDLGSALKKKDRSASADRLVQHVVDNNDPNDEVTLVGFSGGALVSIQAAEKLMEEHGIKVNIVAVNPPAIKDSDSNEHPSGNKGINDMLIMHTEGDPVPGSMPGASSTYKDGSIDLNYQKVKVKSTKKGIGAHMVKNIDMESVRAANMERLDPINNK